MKENQIFYVSEEKDGIAGFIIGERSTGDIALLWLVGVTPGARRNGSCAKLLREFEKECHKRNLKVIVAYATKFSRSALSFWKNFSYEFGHETVEIMKEF